LSSVIHAPNIPYVSAERFEPVQPRSPLMSVQLAMLLASIPAGSGHYDTGLSQSDGQDYRSLCSEIPQDPPIDPVRAARSACNFSMPSERGGAAVASTWRSGIAARIEPATCHLAPSQ